MDPLQIGQIIIAIAVYKPSGLMGWGREVIAWLRHRGGTGEGQ